jgi:transcriptional regulator with XRE-family HTH domain
VPRHSEPDTSRRQRRILSQLGENIRRERQRKGLTQEALAELAGIHSRVLQKMESAQSNILATTLVRIQAALDCPWGLLMSNLNSTESIEAWLKRMVEADDPDWRVFMQKAKVSWENRKKPSPGKISL